MLDEPDSILEDHQGFEDVEVLSLLTSLFKAQQILGIPMVMLTSAVTITITNNLYTDSL